MPVLLGKKPPAFEGTPSCQLTEIVNNQLKTKVTQANSRTRRGESFQCSDSAEAVVSAVLHSGQTPHALPQQFILLFLSSRFCVGDKFFLKNNMILCQMDYEEGQLNGSFETQVQ